LDNGLTVEDRCLATEVGSGADDGGIAVGPIMPVAAEHTRLATLKQHLAPITVVLDFVNPALPSGG
jgi:hypothetical protein